MLRQIRLFPNLLFLLSFEWKFVFTNNSRSIDFLSISSIDGRRHEAETANSPSSPPPPFQNGFFRCHFISYTHTRLSSPTKTIEALSETLPHRIVYHNNNGLYREKKRLLGLGGAID